MARGTAWRADLRRLRYRIENLVPETLDQAEEVMEDITREGADLMRQYIDTRGTDYSLSQDRTGRRENDVMYDAVEHKVHRFGKSVRGEFGWGVDGGREEDYFLYQEHGFRHWITGKDVPPMHAHLDAMIRMREKLFSRLRGMKREGLI